MKAISITVTLFVSLPLLAQTEEVMTVFTELNQHRLHDLEYYHSEQAELDRKAKHLEKIFAHDTRGKGEQFYSECIHYGRDYREAIYWFMNSKGHRQALKDRRAKRVCIGVYQGQESWFVAIRTYE